MASVALAQPSVRFGVLSVSGQYLGLSVGPRWSSDSPTDVKQQRCAEMVPTALALPLLLLAGGALTGEISNGRRREMYNLSHRGLFTFFRILRN